MFSKKAVVLVLLPAVLWVFGPAISLAADAALKPYVLAGESETEFSALAESLREKLTAQDFDIVGEYAVRDGALVLVVTSDEMKAAAAKSAFGGYGVAQRIALTTVEGKVQVSYTNPMYMANVYRMSGDLGALAKKLEATLGKKMYFGSEKGITAKKLRKYHYMMMMPYFDDHIELASYGSHEEALAAVEAGLAAGKGSTKKIFRVDVPGKDEVLFGVAIEEGDGADAAVLGTTDIGATKHTAYLPYEILVSGKKAYAQHGKFRIALSFPDLSMGTFMKISSAPKGIENALSAAAKK